MITSSEWSVSRPRLLYSRKRSSRYQLGGSTASSDAREKYPLLLLGIECLVLSRHCCD
jgi:hypothetical protein